MKRTTVRLIVLTAALAIAPSGYSAEKWLSVRSRNFLLVGNASESSIRRVGRSLEEFRAGFVTLFPAFGKQTPSPITVVVFRDDASLRPFKPLYQGKPANVAGWFQSGADVNFIALAADARTPHTIYHEFVHYLTKDGNAPLPAWASEGLAEFYGMFEIEPNGKEMLLGRPMERHLVTLKEKFLPIDQLLAVDHKSPFYNERDKQGIFYAESWALVHFLMLGNNGANRPRFGNFLLALASGKEIDESFRGAFQTDYSSLEEELRSYITRFSFPAVRYKLQDKIDFDREMQGQPLSDAQAQYYLGDLLLHTGRLDTAEIYLHMAISLDAAFTQTFAALGMLRLREKNYDEALKFLNQAVQGDSAGYLTHYYYAYMLHVAGENLVSTHPRSRLELMRQHLKKTIELAPDYLNAYDLLGYVALRSNEETAQTEELLMKVLPSGRRDIRMRLAELMLRNNKPFPARDIAASLVKVSNDDSIQLRAQDLLDQIQAWIEAQQAAKQVEERSRGAVAEPATAPGNREVPARDRPPALTRKEVVSSSPTGRVEEVRTVVARPAGELIEGLLIAMDCTQGLTLRVRTAPNTVLQFHAEDPSKIELVSYNAAVTDALPCDSLKAELPVLVVYKPGSTGPYAGELLRVEFLEKE